MTSVESPASRFRQYRERAGLSHDDAARQMGISSPSVWDIESHDGELSSCYSPKEVWQFCRVLGVRAVDLFGGPPSEAPISAAELVRLIHEQCRIRGVSLEQFEDVVGWRLSSSLECPDRLLKEMSIDGLQWLCRELGVDWRRVIMAL